MYMYVTKIEKIQGYYLIEIINSKHYFLPLESMTLWMEKAATIYLESQETFGVSLSF